LALGLSPPWLVAAGRFRRRAEAARYRDRLQDRRPLCLPRLRQGRLPGTRHGQEDVAPSGFLPAPGLPARPHRLSQLRPAPHQCTVGAAGLQLHAPVRSVCHDARYIHPGRRCEQQIAEGPWVATRVTYRGTHAGEFEGIPATSKRIEYAGTAMDRLEDGTSPPQKP
jgi:hypothetical protein